MKYVYSVKRVVQLSTALLFIFILTTVIYSCRKELKLTPLNAADSVDAARSWYESTYPVNNSLISVNNNLTTLGVNSTGSTAFDYSQYIKPDWNHTGKYKRFGKDVIEMPVDPSKVLYYGLKNANTGQYTSAKENSRAWFLLLNDGKTYSAYIMVLIGDPGYINGDPSRLANNSYRKRDANFSGMLLYFTPKGKVVSYYKYVNGQQVTGTSQAFTTAGPQTQSLKKTNELATVCIDWYDTVWDGNGNVVWEQYIGTTCGDYDTGGGTGGGGGATNPCQVTNAVTKQAVNVVQNPDPGDSGDGSDPGYPDPSQGSECTQPSLNDTTTKDPCAQKDSLSNLMKTPVMVSQNSSIVAQTDTYEAGSNVNLYNWQNGFNNSNLNPTTVTQSSSTNGWTPTFTWTPNNYTAGFNHGHRNTPPSPRDVFNLIILPSTNRDFQAATTAEKNSFQQNAFVSVDLNTTVGTSTILGTTGGSIIVTINNWDQFADFLQNNFATTDQQDAFTNNFQQTAQRFADASPDRTGIDGGIYALLTMYGSLINIYIADNNSTTYRPVSLSMDSSGNVTIGIKQCN